MPNEPFLNLVLRSQHLDQDASGHNAWNVRMAECKLPATQTALIICDMWDQHWSRGAVERVNEMVTHMNEVICAARAKGILIIHAPSDTMDFYAGAPARQRALDVPAVPLPPEISHDDPPLPIDDSDEGSDTGETEPRWVWTRQHPAIEIDQARDYITDSGATVYSVLRQHGIQQLLIAGVHTNMCVLHRSFGIKQMVRWGVPVALIRDLTDTMYNPACRPYVSHAEGTRLVVEFIEKFWCPTIDSVQLMA